MPMKVNPPNKPKGKEGGTIVSLDQFKKTNLNADNKRQGITAVTNIAKIAANSASLKDSYISSVRQGSPPITAKDIECKKPKEGYEVASNPDNTLLMQETASNDSEQIMCQVLNPGLSVWLESYSGIGMDKDRPTSDANPARHCPYPISVTDIIKSYNGTVSSYKSREATNKPRWSLGSGRGFRVSKHGQYNFCGVAGWGGPRPPTLVQLLVQEYKKGYSFERAAGMKTSERMLHDQPVHIKSNPRINVPKSTESAVDLKTVGQPLSVCDRDSSVEQPETKELHAQPLKAMVHYTEEYYRQQELEYQTWLWQSSRMNNKIAWAPPLHESKIVDINKAFAYIQHARYRNFLWEGDETNPHIDYGLECREDPDIGFKVYPRKSSRANAAARFAPASRFYREKSIFKDWQWEQHLANYAKYERCLWTLSEMIGESLKLWGNRYDLCAFPGIAYHHELLLPPPPEEFKVDTRQTNTGSVKSSNQIESVQVTPKANTRRNYVEPSEHYNDSVCNYFLQKSWKILPNGLIRVPEAFDASTLLTEASIFQVPSLEDIDKICHLKTG